MKLRLFGTHMLVALSCIAIMTFIYFTIEKRNLWLSIPIALAISACFGTYFAIALTDKHKNYLNRISEICKRIANGEQEIDTYSELPQEFENISEILNMMTIRIDDERRQRDKRNKELTAILDSVSNGIIAVDSKSGIVLVNPAAKDLFGIKGEVFGKYFLEVFFDSRLDRALQSAINKGIQSTIEIYTKLLEPKILGIVVAPLKTDDIIVGAVMLLQDITELRRLELIRSDFVANVSHELKTPLTSIKGFIETLLDGAVEDVGTARHFLEIIGIEADRLYRLINDILSLSEIEHKKGGGLLRRVNIAAILGETIDMMKAHAKAKEISLGYLFANEEIWIQANTDMIKQMGINLIDNAIKYTPQRGSVTVLLEDLGDKLILRVKDTGIGIAKEHIPRIFERFYRVDKGRSRSMGGTGLGLAIVKHIVRGMDGYIEIESQPGKGTEFIVHIPAMR